MHQTEIFLLIIVISKDRYSSFGSGMVTSLYIWEVHLFPALAFAPDFKWQSSYIFSTLPVLESHKNSHKFSSKTCRNLCESGWTTSTPSQLGDWYVSFTSRSRGFSAFFRTAILDIGVRLQNQRTRRLTSGVLSIYMYLPCFSCMKSLQRGGWKKKKTTTTGAFPRWYRSRKPLRASQNHQNISKHGMAYHVFFAEQVII